MALILTPRPALGGKRADADRKTTEAQEAIRYAEEIAVATRGAAATAERRREECQHAQARVERAWQDYRKADAARSALPHSGRTAPAGRRVPATV